MDSMPDAKESNFLALLIKIKSKAANNTKAIHIKGTDFLIEFFGRIKKMKKQKKEYSMTVKEERRSTKQKYNDSARSI